MFYATLRRKLGTIVGRFEPFRLYWSIYGGWRELWKSLYLWAAAILTGVCAPLWLEIDLLDYERPAIDLALSIVPALMAFTLAGMAVVLALSGKQFINAIREGGDPNSLFMRVVALFFHFLLVQSFALVMALVSRTYVSSDVLAGIAFFLTVYGITSAVAIAAMLLNISRIYNFTGDDE